MTEDAKLRRQIATKHGLSPAQVDEVVNFQEKFVAHIIGKKSDRETFYFPAVRLPGFGVFYVPDYKIEQFKQVKENAGIPDK